jgi:hypothetical protein
VIAVLLSALLQTVPAAPSDADALFISSRHARTQSAYAHYSVYATVVTFNFAGRPMTSTWDTIEDMRRRLVRSHALSREEGEHPHVPRGFNFNISATVTPPAPAAPGAPSGGAPGPTITHTVNPEPSSDPIGELSFAVDQDFGLALDAQPISATNDMSEVASSATVLPHIGSTGTIARTYEVTDLGDVADAVGPLHHLRLRPLSDPRRYRLRELWTDAKTSLPVRAVVAGIGNAAPLDAVDWRVDFTQLQGGTYVAREVALAPLQTDAGEVDDVTITFDQLLPTNRLTADQTVGFGEIGIRDP